MDGRLRQCPGGGEGRVRLTGRWGRGNEVRVGLADRDPLLHARLPAEIAGVDAAPAERHLQLLLGEDSQGIPVAAHVNLFVHAFCYDIRQETQTPFSCLWRNVRRS
jgi:hypothetical protein